MAVLTRCARSALAALWLALPAAVHAADYHVSPAGTAAWPACTNIATPCSGRTAMENALAGDTVYFRGGIYNPIADPVQQWLDTPEQFRYELPVWNPRNSGTNGQPITFKAYPGETAEILDTGYGAAVLGAYRRDYIVLDGFKATLIDEDPLNSNTHLVSQLIRFDESRHSVVRNCDLKGTNFGRHTNNALITTQRSHYMLIENNRLHDNNGLQPTDPNYVEAAVNTNAIINFFSSNVIVRNNDIYNNYIGIWDKGAEHDNVYYNNHIWGGDDDYTSCKTGIYIRVSAGEQGEGTGIKAYQNVVNGCGVGIYVESGHDPDPPNAYPWLFNNTITGRDDYINNAGLHVTTHARDAQIFNNIIAGYPVQVRYDPGSPAVVAYSDYNDFYSTSANKRWSVGWTASYTTIESWRSATGFDAHSITSDPLFVNGGGALPEDYKLAANSPARTAGRGGAYATVMGAYVTSTEIIGYSPSHVADTLAPAAPSNLTVQ